MWGVRVAIYIDEEGRGHNVGCLLRLFVQHVVAAVTDEWSVVCVEVLLLRQLATDTGQTTDTLCVCVCACVYVHACMLSLCLRAYVHAKGSAAMFWTQI